MIYPIALDGFDKNLLVSLKWSDNTNDTFQLLTFYIIVLTKVFNFTFYQLVEESHMQP